MADPGLRSPGGRRVGERIGGARGMVHSGVWKEIEHRGVLVGML